MEKTPEKMNTSNNSLNKSSKSFTKENSFTQEKFIIFHKLINQEIKKLRAHTHKHDKAKCVICQAKEQKVHKKKDFRQEENKKVNKIVVEPKKMTTSEQNLGHEQNENEKSLKIFLNLKNEKLKNVGLVLEKPNLTMKTMRHPSLTFLFDPLRDEYPNKPYYIDGDPKM